MTDLEYKVISTVIDLIDRAADRVTLNVYRPNDQTLEPGFATQSKLLGEAKDWLEVLIKTA